MDMVDTTDIPTDMVDTMDILMDTDVHSIHHICRDVRSIHHIHNVCNTKLRDQPQHRFRLHASFWLPQPFLPFLLV